MSQCPACGANLAPSAAAVWADFLTAWWARYGSKPVSAQELLELPEARAVHTSLPVFGRLLGAAGNSEAIVDGRRVLRKQWPGTKRMAGQIVYRPATWALEEVS